MTVPARIPFEEDPLSSRLVADTLEDIRKAAFRIGVKRRLDPDDCDDLAQETAIAVANAMRNGSVPVDNPATARQYGLTTASHRCHDRFRKSLVRERARPALREFFANAQSRYGTPESHLEAAEVWRVITKAVDDMPANVSQALELYLDRVEFKDIAAELGLATGTAKLYVARAMDALRKAATAAGLPVPDPRSGKKALPPPGKRVLPPPQQPTTDTPADDAGGARA